MNAFGTPISFLLLGVLITIVALLGARFLSRIPIPAFLPTRRYLAALKELLNEMPFIFRDISLTVLQDYIDTDYEQINTEKIFARRISKRPPLEDILRANRRILILGDAGMGKTTFERYAILDLITKGSRTEFLEPFERCTPIFVPLKAVDNSQPDPIMRYITTAFPLFYGKRGRSRFERLAEANRLLLCLDGYDEISFSAGTHNFVRDELNAILSVPEYRAHEHSVLLAGCRIWLSSRKEFFRDNPISGFLASSRVMALQFKGIGNNRMRLVTNIFAKYSKHSAKAAQTLDPEYFIGQIDSSIDDELVKLSHNPLFLTVMCYIFANQTIDDNATDITWRDSMNKLIDTCIDLLIHDLDDNKARDLLPLRRAALLRRRNAYVTEKHLFLRYFAAQLITKEISLFTLETLKAEVSTFFSKEHKTSNSGAILAELGRDVQGNPHFALQLVYCGIFVIAAVKGRNALYDFPHRRFREVLAAAYIDTPAKYLDLLARRESSGLSEFMKVFRRGRQYSNLDFHRAAFSAILEQSQQNLASNFYVHASEGFLDEKPLGLDVSDAFQSFLVGALCSETPRFRLSERLLALLHDTPELRGQAELTLSEALHAGDGARTLLALKTLFHVSQDATSAISIWRNAVDESTAAASIAAAWISFAIDADVPISDTLLRRIAVDEMLRDLAFFPLALKWQRAAAQQPALVSPVKELPPADRNRLLVRRKLIAEAEIDSVAAKIGSKLNGVVIDAVAHLIDDQDHNDQPWRARAQDTFFISPTSFEQLIHDLREGKSKGLWLSQKRDKATTYSFLGTDDCADIEEVIQSAVLQARGKLLTLQQCTTICYHNIHNALQNFIGKTCKFAELKKEERPPAESFDIEQFMESIVQEIESYRWHDHEVATLREMIIDERRRTSEWCEYFEPPDHWNVRPANQESSQDTKQSREATNLDDDTHSGPSGEIFVSYAWTNESRLIVDQLERAFQRRNVTLFYDRKAMAYRDSIRLFMKRLGRGKCIVTIIGDKYLKSPNCMFELLQIAETGEVRDRVFPIVLRSANIYEVDGVVGYIKYWEDKMRDLDRKIKEVRGEYTGSLHEELDLYADIRAIFDRIVSVLRDMNALSIQEHQTSNFEELVRQVEQRLAK